MNIPDMRIAINEMATTQRAADECAQLAAELLIGRLRKVRGYTLERLKKELRSYNMHTRQWKD